MRRIVVLAYSHVGYECLRYLLDQKENIVAVFTHQLDEYIWFGFCSDLACSYSIPFYYDLSEDLMRSLKPDLIFSFYYRKMIPVPILNLAPLGAYNIHGSLLPKYRGRCPVNWALIHGEKETGATLHVMIDKPDAGDIIDQEPFPIALGDDAGVVSQKMAQASVTLLKRQLKNLKDGTALRKPNLLHKGHYFGGRKPEDGRIDWTQSSWQIYNLIRALSPSPQYPCATTTYKGRFLNIYQAALSCKKISSMQPGEIVQSLPFLQVHCGKAEVIEITKWEWANENEKIPLLPQQILGS